MDQVLTDTASKSISGASEEEKCQILKARLELASRSRENGDQESATKWLNSVAGLSGRHSPQVKEVITEARNHLVNICESRILELPIPLEQAISATEQQIVSKGVFDSRLKFVITSAVDLAAKKAVGIGVLNTLKCGLNVQIEHQEAITRWMNSTGRVKCYMTMFFDNEWRQMAGLPVLLRENDRKFGCMIDSVHLYIIEDIDAGPGLCNAEYAKFALKKIKMMENICWIGAPNSPYCRIMEQSGFDKTGSSEREVVYF